MRIAARDKLCIYTDVKWREKCEDEEEYEDMIACLKDKSGIHWGGQVEHGDLHNEAVYVFLTDVPVEAVGKQMKERMKKGVAKCASMGGTEKLK